MKNKTMKRIMGILIGVIVAVGFVFIGANINKVNACTKEDYQEVMLYDYVLEHWDSDVEDLTDQELVEYLEAQHEIMDEAYEELWIAAHEDMDESDYENKASYWKDQAKLKTKKFKKAVGEIF